MKRLCLTIIGSIFFGAIFFTLTFGFFEIFMLIRTNLVETAISQKEVIYQSIIGYSVLTTLLLSNKVVKQTLEEHGQ